MKIDAEVKNISKLKDYFFLVPDYQREYVWKLDDQVEQYITDIDNEYDAGNLENSYFLGSIILVKNGSKHDVIDGQQRLTTIVITMCALRDLMKDLKLGNTGNEYLKAIGEWLSRFDLETNEIQTRLELQYDESKGYLDCLIAGVSFEDKETDSIAKMREAYERIHEYLNDHLTLGEKALTDFARYFLTKIELVVIESENLSSALKIFETINQRGAGLNAMDLVKNLLFSEVNKPAEFSKIKEKWKTITQNLQRCGEGDSPLRFLRYFLMARYHKGIIREDDIYKWIISKEGKEAIGYENDPMQLVINLEKASQRYADLVEATSSMMDGGDLPSVTRIGFVNKYMSRQHLVLLLALDSNCSNDVLDYLASQLETFFFFSNTLGIQAKYNEKLFAQWAIEFRGQKDIERIREIVGKTLGQYLSGKVAEFKQHFKALRHTSFNPLYRLRYVLGRIDNKMLEQCNTPINGNQFIQNLQVEHILPQTPKNDFIPESYALNRGDYENLVYSLGNVTLLESQINQAVNNFNDLQGEWFNEKKEEYLNSAILMTKMLSNNFAIGQNTATNKLKDKLHYKFDTWTPEQIEIRQNILLELSLQTWTLNNERVDQLININESKA